MTVEFWGNSSGSRGPRELKQEKEAGGREARLVTQTYSYKSQPRVGKPEIQVNLIGYHVRRGLTLPLYTSRSHGNDLRLPTSKVKPLLTWYPIRFTCISGFPTLGWLL